jgi:uncharacterized protein DUF3131
MINEKITAIHFTEKSIGKTRVSHPFNTANAVDNFKKIWPLFSVWLVSLEASLENAPKKGFFQLNQLRFSRKAKCLIAVAVAAVLLISAFAFLPKQNVNGDNAAPGLIQSANVINSPVWMKVAANAWAYYQPGVGVNVNTGLPYAGTGFTGFTDWDLGCYIQAAINAQKLGLIGNDSAWDFSARIDKVLTFLENRPLNTTTDYPFQFYDGRTGQDCASISQKPTVDISDTGRLFIALNNLINFNSSLRQTVDNIVLNGRSDYIVLLPEITSLAGSNSIYSYFDASGFASFWPDQLSSVPSSILNNIFSAGNVTTYGNVWLPEASICCDPLLSSVFELNNNSSQLMALSRQVYLASAAYYNATGDYAAFSEGNSPSSDGKSNNYIWEWVVLPNGDTWKITGSGTAYLNIKPVIYNKVAFSFLALYNTTYARNTLVYLEQTLPYPTNGYYDGADNSGNFVPDDGSNTNSLILDAALYAIQK